MARRSGRPAEGETRFGARERNHGAGDGALYVRGAASRPSFLLVDDDNGDTFALWVDAGTLRIKQVDADDLRTSVSAPASDGSAV